DRLAEAALRTLGVAYRSLATTEAPEAAAAIAEAHAAGLRVIMITGDHPRTAARIATDLGIATPAPGRSAAASLSGLELDALLNRAFATTPLSAADWALCAAMASVVLWVDELKKLLLRRTSRRPWRSGARSSSPAGRWPSATGR
ncbi:MAG TPA: HAD family hydrolase, partial [Actinomycetes bacterium]|nr:HAD family hydrolase [Actinomycetes bacterium]